MEPITGVHTNTIECTCRPIKNLIKRGDIVAKESFPNIYSNIFGSEHIKMITIFFYPSSKPYQCTLNKCIVIFILIIS